MKFLHAADLHIDSPLRGLDRYEGAPTDALRDASRRALKNMVTYALEEDIDFVIIAGDIYDVDWKDYNTGQFFFNQLARLSNANIPILLVRGNHDARNSITRELTLPKLAHEFSFKRPESFPLDQLGVVLHGQSYQERETLADLSANYPAPVPGAFNIGVLHTALTGRPGHDAYAPCTVEALATKGYDYWALGHVHQREIVCQDPWVVFPGNLQGRHIRESGPKGASVVTVEGGRVSSVQHVTFDVVRWADCRVDVSRSETADAALDQVISALGEQKAEVDDQLLAVRVTITGECAAHDEFFRKKDHWQAQLRNAVSERYDQGVWLEKIRFETSPVIDLAALRRRGDPLGKLFLELEGLQSDASPLSDLCDELSRLVDKLPPQYKNRPEAFVPDSAAALSSLLPEVERFLLAQLRRQEDAP